MDREREDEHRHAPTPDASDPDSPTGGDESTEERLDADNPVEEDTLKALDPDDSPA